MKTKTHKSTIRIITGTPMMLEYKLKVQTKYEDEENGGLKIE